MDGNVPNTRTWGNSRRSRGGLPRWVGPAKVGGTCTMDDRVARRVPRAARRAIDPEGLHQVAASECPAHLGERLFLELPDPLARQVVLVPDLLERQLLLGPEAEPLAQDVGLD